MDFPSCLVLDAGFDHQMQSNPGMSASEHENGHHQLTSAEHDHGAYVQALGLITSRQEHASNRICGRSPSSPDGWAARHLGLQWPWQRTHRTLVVRRAIRIASSQPSVTSHEFSGSLSTGMTMSLA
jgi:hypothetical protein